MRIQTSNMMGVTRPLMQTGSTGIRANKNLPYCNHQNSTDVIKYMTFPLVLNFSYLTDEVIEESQFLNKSLALSLEKSKHSDVRQSNLTSQQMDLNELPQKYIHRTHVTSSQLTSKQTHQSISASSVTASQKLKPIILSNAQVPLGDCHTPQNYDKSMHSFHTIGNLQAVPPQQNKNFQAQQYNEDLTTITAKLPQDDNLASNKQNFKKTNEKRKFYENLQSQKENLHPHQVLNVMTLTQPTFCSTSSTVELEQEFQNSYNRAMSTLVKNNGVRNDVIRSFRQKNQKLTSLSAMSLSESITPIDIKNVEKQLLPKLVAKSKREYLEFEQEFHSKHQPLRLKDQKDSRGRSWKRRNSTHYSHHSQQSRSRSVKSKSSNRRPKQKYGFISEQLKRAIQGVNDFRSGSKRKPLKRKTPKKLWTPKRQQSKSSQRAKSLSNCMNRGSFQMVRRRIVKQRRVSKGKHLVAPPKKAQIFKSAKPKILSVYASAQHQTPRHDHHVRLSGREIQSSCLKSNSSHFYTTELCSTLGATQHTNQAESKRTKVAPSQEQHFSSYNPDQYEMLFSDVPRSPAEKKIPSEPNGLMRPEPTNSQLFSELKQKSKELDFLLNNLQKVCRS